MICLGRSAWRTESQQTEEWSCRQLDSNHQSRGSTRRGRMPHAGSQPLRRHRLRLLRELARYCGLSIRRWNSKHKDMFAHFNIEIRNTCLIIVMFVYTYVYICIYVYVHIYIYIYIYQCCFPRHRHRRVGGSDSRDDDNNNNYYYYVYNTCY